MTALAALLDDGTLSKLTRLQVKLITAPPPPAEPTAAVCPTCGQPRRPAPPAVFRAPGAE